MKLQDLATKPKLELIVVDKPELVEKYGEEITFYILDRLPIDTFTKLASLKQDNIAEMYSVMQDLVLDEKGLPIMSEDAILPVDILTECIVKVSDFLGKSVGSNS